MSNSPSQGELAAYADVLTEVKGRLDAGYLLLDPQTELNVVYAVELAALQLRKVLELLLLGSLLTNKAALAQSERVLSKANPDEARKLVSRLNAGYWPAPVVQAAGQGGAKYDLVPVEDGYLRRVDYGRAYGLTSVWCHARNPLAQPLDASSGRADLKKLEEKLRCLVNHFTVELVDRDTMLVCQMSARLAEADPATSGQVQVVLFEQHGLTWSG